MSGEISVFHYLFGYPFVGVANEIFAINIMRICAPERNFFNLKFGLWVALEKFDKTFVANIIGLILKKM